MSRILPTTIALGDIADVENFIQNSITRSGVQLTDTERAELVAEGLAIMVELWHRYDPNKDRGGAPRPDGSTHGVASFAGYANFLLGRKLGDAWHRMNDHHTLRTDTTTDPETGTTTQRKYWHYGDPHHSLDQLNGWKTPTTTTTDETSHRTLGNFIKVPLAL